MAGKIVISKQS